MRCEHCSSNHDHPELHVASDHLGEEVHVCMTCAWTHYSSDHGGPVVGMVVKSTPCGLDYLGAVLRYVQVGVGLLVPVPDLQGFYMAAVLPPGKAPMRPGPLEDMVSVLMSHQGVEGLRATCGCGLPGAYRGQECMSEARLDERPAFTVGDGPVCSCWCHGDGLRDPRRLSLWSSLYLGQWMHYAPAIRQGVSIHDGGLEPVLVLDVSCVMGSGHVVTRVWRPTLELRPHQNPNDTVAVSHLRPIAPALAVEYNAAHGRPA